MRLAFLKPRMARPKESRCVRSGAHQALRSGMVSAAPADDGCSWLTSCARST